jgi:hypothetical protein
MRTTQIQEAIERQVVFGKRVNIIIAGISAMLVRQPKSFTCSVKPVIRPPVGEEPGMISPQMNCNSAPRPESAAENVQRIIAVFICVGFCNKVVLNQNHIAIKYRYFISAVIDVKGIDAKPDDIIPPTMKRNNPKIINGGNLISKFFLRRHSDVVRRNEIKKNQSDIVNAKAGLKTVWPIVSNPR